MDVATTREKSRQRRLIRLGLGLVLIAWWCWSRALSGNSLLPGMPDLGLSPELMIPLGLLVIIGGVIVGPMLFAGKSPHVIYHPSELRIGFEDVRGAGVVRDEVIKTLNLFLAHKTFESQMGGTPRKAILFEGPPGTGKTYMAKAMAKEAGVPFLFVSSSAFQSMYYGQTNRKIRTFFKSLRAQARQEGGAIGFIEEIDAIGAARRGMQGSTSREGISGVVNELLIQLQSFDTPPRSMRFVNWWIDKLNRYLPTELQRNKRLAQPANVLVVGATNRAADLDPALLRPGRFDRSIYFGLPGRADRRDIIDYYLDRKAYTAELDDEKSRSQLAAMTFGYSPVMLEHLFDEALVWALRRGDRRFAWTDIQQAKMTEELGLREKVEYSTAERRVIATHEAGHATVAHLVGHDCKLDVLSIIKRKQSLGLLAHSDKGERFTKSRSEILAQIQIAMGGMAAEELWFGESGTGPGGDLQAATNAAAMMVGSLGMGNTLISFDAVEVAGNLVAKVLADEETRESVESILRNAKTKVTELLDANRGTVEALRDALIERDELVGDEILEVIRGAAEPPAQASPTDDSTKLSTNASSAHAS